MNNKAEFLTPAEVSARWGGAIQTSTLANWRSRKVGPPFQKVGARVLYPLAALEAWEQANRHTNDNPKEGAGKAA